MGWREWLEANPHALKTAVGLRSEHWSLAERQGAAHGRLLPRAVASRRASGVKVAGEPGQPNNGQTRFNDALIKQADGLPSRKDLGPNVLVLLSQLVHATRRQQICFSAEHHHTLGAAARGRQESLGSLQPLLGCGSAVTTERSLSGLRALPRPGRSQAPRAGCRPCVAALPCRGWRRSRPGGRA